MKNSIQVKNPQEYFQMPKEYQNLVLHQLRQHAEGELIGADDYLEYFYPIAPNAFERKVCCERASEEVDHYMRAAIVLNDIGYDASHMLKQNIDQRKYYKTEGVVKVKSWIMRGFFSFIGEAAVLAIIEEMSESSYLPIAEMTKQVIIDEYVHVVNGRRIVEDFLSKNSACEAQDEFEEAWAMSLDLFGDSNSERSKSYLKWGLRKYSNAEARIRFITKMSPELELLGFKIPKDNSRRKFL